MAKMKIEVLNARNREHRLPLRERMIAYLPRYAPFAARAAPLINLVQRLPGAGLAGEALGFSRKRPLPAWRKPFGSTRAEAPANAREVLLFADTFNRYFEPENLTAASELLSAGGYRVSLAGDSAERPLCCGRTFLAAGLVEEARREASRFLNAVKPAIERGAPVIGLEPSCLLTLRDEFLSLLPGPEPQVLARQAFLIEEFLAREVRAGGLRLSLQPAAAPLLVHGHCHQKAFSAISPLLDVLRLIPEAAPQLIETSCCGMAGAFGYGRDTYDISVQMAELDLLPTLRRADQRAVVVADGFSCRHQIADLSGRKARHAVRVLRDALSEA